MSKVNYDAMSDAELKQYFLSHRQEESVFKAYLDRLNQHPHRIIASPSDPDFDDKVHNAVLQKLRLLNRDTDQQVDDSN